MSEAKTTAHGAKSSGKFEVLAKIREAETRAEKAIADAEKSRQKIIEDAQKKAVAMQSEAEGRIKGKSDSELKGFYESLGRKKEKILSDCAKDVAELKKQSEKKLPKAADFLFERFGANVAK